MRVRVLLAAVALPLVLWAILPLGSAGQTSKQQELDSAAAADRQRAQEDRPQEGRRARADVPRSPATSGASASCRARSRRSQTRQQTIEVDLDAKRAELERLQADLRAERARLVRLRARLNETRRVLRVRLIEIYKAGKPDLITVILNSDGFADLIERSEFIARISDQDRKIITLVSAAKLDATRSEKRLARLEDRQQKVTEIVQARRDEVAAIKMELIGTRVGYSTARRPARPRR